MGDRTRSRDAGFALPASILLGVVAIILMAGTAAYTMGRLDDNERRRDRVVAMPVVDTAITRLKVGFEQNLLAEHRDYVPTKGQLVKLLQGTNATVLDGSYISPAIPAGMPNVTVREPLGDRAGYWQLLRVFPPEYDEADDEGVVVIYLRAWLGSTNDPSVGTEPRLVRIEFRPGRFADYQAVIDGPIIFGPDATLNGPIHSNGFADERANFKDTLNGSEERVSTFEDAVVQCTAAAQITTAQGGVKNSEFPGCPVQENTGRYVNLLSAEEAFERIRKACAEGVASARCFDQTYEGSSVPASVAQKEPDLRGYRVKLNGDSLTVSGYEINFLTESPEAFAVSGAGTYATPAGSTTVLFFADNVVVDGSTNGRVTIAARKPGAWTPNVKSGAANIYIRDNVGHSGAGSVLGLMSQGGVILDGIKNGSGNYPCITKVKAGIVAMTGTLSIDPRYTTRLYQAGGPSCGPIEITGSLAAHRSPVLVWKWDNVSGHAGYSEREYAWSDSLRRNPPPYFPITDSWEARHVRPANLDCFSGGNVTNQDC